MVLLTEQRLLRPHGFADCHLVVRCTGKPADLYRRRRAGIFDSPSLRTGKLSSRTGKPSNVLSATSPMPSSARKRPMK